jgi:hypothetical protein
MPEVVEFSNYLSVFLFELPDPNEELYYQYPHTFRLFPKLPLEIRVNIWRQTFPRRTHMIFNGPYKPFPCFRVRYTPPPPVSSRVNFESRQETLRHYKVLQTSTLCTCYSLRPKTLYFHPEIDILRGWDTHLKVPNNIERDWDYHFKVSLEEFASSVRFLEMICVSLDHDEEEDEIEICEEGILGNFDALQKLRILDIGYRLPAEYGPASDQLRLDGPGGQVMIQALTRFFQLQAAEEPGCAVPEVSIRNFES